ncbi:MAG: hypothetical protein ACYC2G_03245 [Gemmatimonadaceae bacterium]
MPGIQFRRFALAGLLVATAGCYRYTTLAPADVTPGHTVRVELDDQGTAELSRWIGARGASLEGRVQAVSDTAITLAVTDVVRLNGVTEPWKSESVLIPRRLAESVGVRRLDRQRTIWTSVGTLAALIAANSIMGNGNGLFGLGGRNSGSRQ